MSGVLKTVKINDKPLGEITGSPWPLVSANGDIMGSEGNYLGNYKYNDMEDSMNTLDYTPNAITNVPSFAPWTVNDWASGDNVGEEDDIVGEEEAISIDRRNIKKLVEEVLVENGLMGPKTTNEPKGLTLRRLKHR